MKVIEILRLKEMNLFMYCDFVASVDCSKTTVGETFSRWKKQGLTYENVSLMTQDQINKFIFPESFDLRWVKEYLTGKRTYTPQHLARELTCRIYGKRIPAS